jgi:hypothetical protein
MKTKVLLFAAVIAFFTVACKDEKGLVNDRLVTNQEVKFTDDEFNVLCQMRNKDNKVSIEEATRLANDVIGFLDGESATKSGTARSIKSVDALTSENLQTVALKSNDGVNVEIPDTIAYVFNFGEEDGFAIISADTRIEAPILGYSGSGTLGTEIDNPGLGMFLEGTEDYILRSIADAEHKRDSLIGMIMTKLNVQNESDTKVVTTTTATISNMRIIQTVDTRTTSQVSPLLPVQWGQGTPYNQTVPKSCTNRTDGKAPAGCVATAVAQIMAYWRHPASIDGTAMNWTELTRYTARPDAYDNVRGKLSVNNSSPLFRNQVAHLMERIGKYTKMNYGCDGSGTSSGNAITYLNNLGYRVAVWPAAYNYNTVLLMLNNRIPVSVGGYSSKTTHKFLGITVNTTYSGGHQWVVDGYLNQIQYVTITVEQLDKSTGKVLNRTTSSGTNTISYLHNNWGWNGSDNGYYIAGSFNADDMELASGTKSESKYNFQYANDMFAVYR